MIKFRNIELNDHDSMIKLLKQLTECNYDNIKFKEYVNNLPKNIHHIIVEKNKEVIGTGKIILETKIIHNFQLVGHIEDIVIDSKFRGQNIGKQLIDYLINIAKNNNCYKVILHCNDKTSNFYKNLKFKNNNNQSMSLYFI